MNDFQQVDLRRGGYLFRKPVKGKKAKTISCKEAHLKEQVSEMVYKNPDIRRVSQAEVIEKISYIQVMDADTEGRLSGVPK